MYQLQLLFFNQGDWENTVYKPMEYQLAQALLKHYRSTWGNTHAYRLILAN